MSSRSMHRLTPAVGVSLLSSTADTDIEQREGGSSAVTALELENVAGRQLRAPLPGGGLLPSMDRSIAVNRLKVHYGALALLGTISLVFFLLGWLSGPPEARSEFFGAGAVCFVAFTLTVTAGAAQTGLVWILQPLVVVMGLFAVAAIARRKAQTSSTLPQSSPTSYTVVVARGT